MQIVSFRPIDSDEPLRAGFSDGVSIVASTDIGCADSVKQLLVDSPDLRPVLAAAREALASNRGVISAGAVQLGPAVPDPDKVLCIGVNYQDHARESGEEVGAFPPVFAKFRNSLIGPSDDIVMPGISDDIDYEVELAVIIGRTCKDVATADALDYVAGYSIFNDVSARDVQFRSPQWISGKMLDTFGPLGPGITPRLDIDDVQALRLRTTIDGTVLQDSNTANMIWSVAMIVSYLSEILTLEPGDVIATGTPGGVGFARDPQVWLRPGDVVECEIEHLGVLRNPVVGARS